MLAMASIPVVVAEMAVSLAAVLDQSAETARGDFVGPPFELCPRTKSQTIKGTFGNREPGRRLPDRVHRMTARVPAAQLYRHYDNVWLSTSGIKSSQPERLSL